MQNLPRNYLDTLGLARDLVSTKKVETLKFIYGNVPDTLSQLVRTAFIPSKGNTSLISDFSAIEGACHCLASG
ncbi:DNA-directed DNA polymerase family A palm domain-containing protein OS=Lysinibacillus sphaericus OX=1421 GN=LS41612_04525 PE=4 SV=1 [Lysinibacillus sphaericus]